MIQIDDALAAHIATASRREKEQMAQLKDAAEGARIQLLDDIEYIENALAAGFFDGVRARVAEMRRRVAASEPSDRA